MLLTLMLFATSLPPGVVPMLMRQPVMLSCGPALLVQAKVP